MPIRALNIYIFTNSLLAVLLLLSLLVSDCFARELKVCVDQYPPFKIIADEEVVGGLDIELIEAVTAEIGLKPNYSYAPWTRCLAYLRSGHTDLVSGITKRKDRERYLLYIEPPYKTKSVKVFYVKKGTGKKISSFDDLAGLTVGMIRGARYFEKFDYNLEIIKHPVSDESSALKMLKADRLDAFITTEEVGDYLITMNNYSNYFDKAEYRYEKDVAVYFAMSKNSMLVDKLADFNQAVEKLKETGVFDKITADFFKND